MHAVSTSLRRGRVPRDTRAPRRGGAGWPARVANHLCVAAAAAMIWLPEIRAYHVAPPAVGDAQIERSRAVPGDEVLREIAAQYLGGPTGVTPERVRDTAERLRRGWIDLPRFPPGNVGRPLRPRDLERGLPSDQLLVAGLVTVDVSLRAYRQTEDVRYLLAARDDLLAIDEIDRWSVLPTGFLWNDHALATRVAALAEFWRAARGHDDVDHETRRAVLGLAARTGELLAAPGQFTYRTNHGVMQNVALLQLAAAFPALEGAARFRDLACARLVEQAAYYVSPEGPILEHSAGYHDIGLQLMRTARRLMQLNGCPVPADWSGKIERAAAFLALLQRPDGTLPVVGDTDHGASALDVERADFGPGRGQRAAPDRARALYPVSGYAVWWTGLAEWPRADALGQTVVAWSRFPSGAHKLADDASVLIWARGRPWITSTGYWPYGLPERADAGGWRGSNALHLVGEPAGSARETRLLGHAEDAQLCAIDLERRLFGPAAVLRRQVVAVGGDTWIVVDSVAASGERPADRVWTTMPDTTVTKLARDDFLLVDRDGRGAARVTIAGDVVRAPVAFRGSLDPFAGWAVVKSHPMPAPAIEVRQAGGDSLVATIVRLASAQALRAAAKPALAAGAEAERWQVTVPTEGGPLVVGREGARIRFARDGVPAVDVGFARPPPVDRERNAVVAAYRAAAEKHPRMRELVDYRWKVTKVAVVVLILQFLAVAAVRRVRPGAEAGLRWAAAGAWLAFGAWAGWWYLV